MKGKGVAKHMRNKRIKVGTTKGRLRAGYNTYKGKRFSEIKTYSIEDLPANSTLNR